MGKQPGADHLKPSGRFFGGGERRGARPEGRRFRADARPIRLRCPGCGATVRVYEDEIGRSGQCSGCGAVIAVPADAFKEARSASVGSGVAARRGPAREAEAQATAQATPTEPPVAASQQVVRPPEGLQDAAAQLAVAPGEAELSRSVGASPQVATRVDYRLWQGIVAEGGDAAMAARLGALRAAEEAGCPVALRFSGGAELPAPPMVLCEAAVGAAKGQSEDEWRRDWSRQLVRVAARWPDEPTFDAVVAILAHVDSVIARLKTAGVWPWADAAGGAH